MECRDHVQASLSMSFLRLKASSVLHTRCPLPGILGLHPPAGRALRKSIQQWFSLPLTRQASAWVVKSVKLGSPQERPMCVWAVALISTVVDRGWGQIQVMLWRWNRQAWWLSCHETEEEESVVELRLSECLPGFPWWLSDKEFACWCRRCRFYPWVGKIPWRRKWQPTPVFLPGKRYGQKSLVGCSSWGYKELDWTEHACMNICLSSTWVLGYCLPSAYHSAWHLVNNWKNVYWSCVWMNDGWRKCDPTKFCDLPKIALTTQWQILSWNLGYLSMTQLLMWCPFCGLSCLPFRSLTLWRRGLCTDQYNRSYCLAMVVGVV